MSEPNTIMRERETSEAMRTKAVVTLVHGTWARAAAWARSDSPLCQSLREAAAQSGSQVEFKTCVWSGSNSVRGREEAARTLVEQLGKDFKQAPTASHFIIGHSHGGNIAVDAACAPGVGERLSGIVTMSTPFVSCRRSGIRLTGALLYALTMLALVQLSFYLLFSGLHWIEGQAQSLLSSAFVQWPLLILFCFITYKWTVSLTKEFWRIVFEGFPDALGFVHEAQDDVLGRFDRHLKHPIPMFCIRFRMDEALVALNLSRGLVRPIRLLTFGVSWVVGIAAGVWLSACAVGFFVSIVASLLDLVHGTNVHTWEEVIVKVAIMVMTFGIWPMIALFLIWTVLGYLMGSLTLGHWGGLIDQLLVDFRITGTPDGANAVSKVYSPLRWPRTLRHSLTYGDRKAIADISEWFTARLFDDTKTRLAAPR